MLHRRSIEKYKVLNPKSYVKICETDQETFFKNIHLKIEVYGKQNSSNTLKQGQYILTVFIVDIVKACACVRVAGAPFQLNKLII